MYEPVVIACHGEAQEQNCKESDERRLRRSNTAIFLLSGKLCFALEAGN
jgi:hypothetical protein